MSPPSEFADYKFLKLKYNAQQSCCHQILFRPHNPPKHCDEESKPRDKTLFVANIPPWATTKMIKQLFSVNGKISNVFFQLQPSNGPGVPKTVGEGKGGDIFPLDRFLDPYSMESGFKYAYIVYKCSHSVTVAMGKMDLAQEYIASIENHALITGPERWNKYYNKTKLGDEIKVDVVKEYMEDYDKTKAMEEYEEKKRKMEGPDDEGWVTVGSRGKKKDNLAKKTQEPDKLTGERERAKNGRRRKKKIVNTNFYTSQKREEKIDRIREMREKFERDKEKLAKMQSERKFRPF